jgi:hypothetical protein
MWVGIILACGTLNGEVTKDCRTFGADRNVASEEQCLQQITIGNIVMQENNWTMVDWYCLNWDEVNRNRKLGEPV